MLLLGTELERETAILLARMGQQGLSCVDRDGGDWNNEIRIEWVVNCFNLLKSNGQGY